MNYAEFQERVREKGQELYRDMPWRRDTRPYYILVSELMLQQTQVGRVIPKFESFIKQFPDFAALAQAPLAEVLKAWTGLGYNRRAKYLHQAAQRIVVDHGGAMPNEYEQIKNLPGIGPATAGAIMVYAFNQPVVFIETNVRTVYFYSFFESHQKVSDAEIAPLLEATIDTMHPREFYWALMDYGAWLKRRGKVANSQSVHYKKQSKFKGSLREVRGKIIRLLAENDYPVLVLEQELGQDERFVSALEGLLKDGLVIQKDEVVSLTK